MKPTDDQIQTVKLLAANGHPMTYSVAKKHAAIILENTADYYDCGDREEETRTDDFYYDAKEYFQN